MNEVCSRCPPGYVPRQDKTDCVLCPQNSFALSGSPVCTPCLQNQYALTPSSSCANRPACLLTDIHYEYSRCNHLTATRTKYWVFNDPHICSLDPSFLPSNQTVPCAPCNPGFHANHTGDACLACPPGSSSALGSTSCSLCPIHTYAPKQFYVHNWEHFQFQAIPHSTSCVGTCATNGFQMKETSLDSGSNHGSVVLTFTLTNFEVCSAHHQFTNIAD